MHNHIIERMWWDVIQGVLSFYRHLFYHVEALGLLDPDDDLHIFCLHYIFIPRLNSLLTEHG